MDPWTPSSAFKEQGRLDLKWLAGRGASSFHDVDAFQTLRVLCRGRG